MAETKNKTATVLNAVDTKKEKTVKIRIPRTRKDEEDKIVWVNERRFLIKRGEEVEVPECVAEVIRNSEKMLEQAYDFENEVQK